MQISTSTSGKPLRNSLRHLLRKCHLPRRGRLPTSERVGRGRCPHLPADGWGQPSLRQGRCGIVGAFCERPRANTVRPYNTDSTPVRDCRGGCPHPPVYTSGNTSSTACGGPPFRSPRNGPPFVGYADIFPRYRGKSTSRGRLSCPARKKPPPRNPRRWFLQ